MKRRIVLVGPPASGKGTQAELIREHFEIPVASPGAILREESRAGTPLGKEAEALTSQGLLVPDAMVLKVVERWLGKVDGGFVFDGFPRTVGQAEGLEKLLHSRGTPLEVVIALEADLPTLQARVSNRLVCAACGRNYALGIHIAGASDRCPHCGGQLVKRGDDTLETLERRMREYAEKTAPLMGYYRKLGLLHCVNTHSTPEEAFAAVARILETE